MGDGEYSQASRDHGFGRDGAAVGDSLAGSPWRRFPTFEPPMMLRGGQFTIKEAGNPL